MTAMTAMTTTAQETARMETPAQAQQKALLQLEGVTKVFETEEVETHALSGTVVFIALVPDPPRPTRSCPRGPPDLPR